MANYVIFIGPNCSGKSYICKKLSEEILYYKHYEMDKLTDVDGFFGQIKDIEKLRDNESIYLIDAGAVFQYRCDFESWLEHKNKLLCLHITPEESWKRFQRRNEEINRSINDSPHKTFESLESAEYCDKRKRLNSAANHKIDANTLFDSEENEKIIKELVIDKIKLICGKSS